ncbi:immunoglobulin superfamily containing leucine-rich repeat protein, partial [Sigmodon hispidus]
GTMQTLRLFGWAVLLNLVQACPESCDCGEKYGFQIADSFRDTEAVPSGFPANVAAGALASLSQLKSLDLSHNLISEFAWCDLHNLSALQLLKTDSNELAFIPWDAFRSLHAL